MATPVKRKKQQPTTEEKKEASASAALSEVKNATQDEGAAGKDDNAASSHTQSPTNGRRRSSDAARSSSSILCGMFVILSVLGLVVAALYSSSRPEYYTMPPELSEHYSEGMFLPVHDGTRPLKIFVRDFQQPSDIGAETVLLLPGLTTSSFHYREAATDLSKHHHLRAITFDFPGAGLSEKPSDLTYTTRYLTEITANVVNLLNVPAVHLVLPDTSAAIGLEFTAQHPTLVRSVTLVNALTSPNATLPLPFPLNAIALLPSSLRRIALVIATSPLCARVLWRFTADAYMLSRDHGVDTFLAYFDALHTLDPATASRIAHILTQLSSSVNISIQTIYSEDAVSAVQIPPTLRPRRQYVISRSVGFIPQERYLEFAKHISAFIHELPATPELSARRAAYQKAAEHAGHSSHSGHGHGIGGFGGYSLHGTGHGMGGEDYVVSDGHGHFEVRHGSGHHRHANHRHDQHGNDHHDHDHHDHHAH